MLVSCTDPANLLNFKRKYPIILGAGTERLSTEDREDGCTIVSFPHELRVVIKSMCIGVFQDEPSAGLQDGVLKDESGQLVQIRQAVRWTGKYQVE